MKKTTVFRSLLKKNEALVMPGSYDPLSAKIVEWAGFPAVYLSGASAAAAVLGAPDIGLMTMTEVVTNVRNIVNAVNVPVIADSDTGYGDAMNMTRTAKEFERAGVAGIHIEDLAKHQCGLMPNKELLSREEMIGRIRATKDTIEDEDFTLIARTDAIGAIGGGIDEAIKRANMYVEAGADAIWVQEPPPEQQSVEMFKKLPKSIKAPLMVAAGYNYHTITEFEDWGYKIVFYPTSNSVQVTMKALMDVMKDIKEKGRDKEFCKTLPTRGLPFEEYMKFMEFQKYVDIREKYCKK